MPSQQQQARPCRACTPAHSLSCAPRGWRSFPSACWMWLRMMLAKVASSGASPSPGMRAYRRWAASWCLQAGQQGGEQPQAAAAVRRPSPRAGRACSAGAGGRRHAVHRRRRRRSPEPQRGTACTAQRGAPQVDQRVEHCVGDNQGGAGGAAARAPAARVARVCILVMLLGCRQMRLRVVLLPHLKHSCVGGLEILVHLQQPRLHIRRQRGLQGAAAQGGQLSRLPAAA